MKVETVSSIVRGTFRAQRLMPGWVEELDFYTLSDYHRMVLINDGGTQPLVMARFVEPLQVILVGRVEHMDAVGLAGWLGEVLPVSFRRVEIHGQTCGKVHVVADAAYVPSLLPADLVRALQDGTISVGAGIRRFGLETRRELLWCGRTDGYPVVRCYRVFYGQKPVFAITERFA